LHIALQRRVLQLELLANRIVPQFEHVEKLRGSADTWVSIEPGVMVRRNSQGKIDRRISPALKVQTGERTLDIASPERSAEYDGRAFNWSVMAGGKRPRMVPRCEFFDADKIGERIVLRHWRAGDRFQPIGMPGPVKLQDWFVNQKVPRARRHELVIATTVDGEIFWIEDQRIAEKFKVTPATRRILHWQWR
jgi:tRNA(Ile)-lysidine synthase